MVSVLVLLTGKIFCDAISICNSCSSSNWTETWRCKCLDRRCHAISIQSLLKGTSELCGITRRCLSCKHYIFLLHALINSKEVQYCFLFLGFLFCFCFFIFFILCSYTGVFLVCFCFYRVVVFFKDRLEVDQPHFNRSTQDLQKKNLNKNKRGRRIKKNTEMITISFCIQTI